ncbi:hypothetical protein BCR42DRAFT_430154 [Absidia repens]|uniref:Uncharacterized protein n=1 Tax=Absidia repens TaxID=90262 RepID=A0A1X2HKC0_9FUNG|nr:hypothetical protein BCR42DRAFT_430154 [Absidia repens]
MHLLYVRCHEPSCVTSCLCITVPHLLLALGTCIHLLSFLFLGYWLCNNLSMCRVNQTK